MNSEAKTVQKYLIIGIIFFILVVGLWMASYPLYKVWSREQAGKAELAEAKWNRQIAVEEARAKLESERLNALSEVERAKGVAEANRIIGDSLTGNESYLRYLWITKLEEGQNKQVIYVPTEAGLPLLEAQRLTQPSGQ